MNVPLEWKSQVVIPILKPHKDPKDSNSYRPISLTSCVGKIFEVILNNRIEWYLESKLKLARSQSGFRKGLE